MGEERPGTLHRFSHAVTGRNVLLYSPRYQLQTILVEQIRRAGFRTSTGFDMYRSFLVICPNGATVRLACAMTNVDTWSEDLVIVNEAQEMHFMDWRLLTTSPRMFKLLFLGTPTPKEYDEPDPLRKYYYQSFNQPGWQGWHFDRSPLASDDLLERWRLEMSVAMFRTMAQAEFVIYDTQKSLAAGPEFLLVGKL